MLEDIYIYLSKYIYYIYKLPSMHIYIYTFQNIYTVNSKVSGIHLQVYTIIYMSSTENKDDSLAAISVNIHIYD